MNEIRCNFSGATLYLFHFIFLCFLCKHNKQKIYISVYIELSKCVPIERAYEFLCKSIYEKIDLHIQDQAQVGSACLVLHLKSTLHALII